MRFLFSLLLLSLCFFQASAQKNITLSGYIREKGSLETLPGVNVYTEGGVSGTSSNGYGFYSITLPAHDSLVFVFSCVGYQSITKSVSFRSNIALNVELEPSYLLEEIKVSAYEDSSLVSQSVQMSTVSLPVSQVRKLPALMGEKDVLKILQLMPGVQKSSEGQTGIYVRGGGADQNLLILDDATVYNASHLFGFFSVFNGDALKSVELTKGGFPARFGGRLSSVIEMRMKEGDKEKFHAEGGIGLLSSRLTVEGPILKNKASFIISARRTYIDLLAKPFLKTSYYNSYDSTHSNSNIGYYFYDTNAKVNFDLNRKDKIYLSFYLGSDRFYQDEDRESTRFKDERKAGLNWGNITGTMRWNHQFSQKLFANTSLIFTRFRFGIDASEQTQVSNKDLKMAESYRLRHFSEIRDLGLKTDFDYFPDLNHIVKFGFQTVYHTFTPSAVVIEGDYIGPLSASFDPVHSLETAAYLEDTWSPIPDLKLNSGLRLSLFSTKSRWYFRPEPRIAGAYRINDRLSAKASFAVMNQFVHLLSNSGLGLPTDLWVPSTGKIPPQNSYQFAAGLARDFVKQKLALTIEGYYKKMNNIIHYREGVSFLEPSGSNLEMRDWENTVIFGKGKSYGTEVLLQKKTGRLSGWVGYTLSWTILDFKELNDGKPFFARHDRRHDFSIVGVYEWKKNITLTSTWVFGTGNALTVPIATYKIEKEELVQVGQKNSFRAEPYHRLDVAIRFTKKKKRHERTWEMGVYNAYNRRNPFIYSLNENYDRNSGKASQYTLRRLSLFPVLPYVTYQFRF